MSESRVPSSAVGFEDFGQLALDSSLTPIEKIGFVDKFRRGSDPAILKDWNAKLPALKKPKSKILDLGCGLSSLTTKLIGQSRRRQQRLFLIDHENVLAQIRSKPASLHPGRFPKDHALFLKQHAQSFDAILVYSVIQYVFKEGHVDRFLDKCLGLVAPGGRLLIGDIPNASMRRRLLDSPEGRAYHHEHFAGLPYPRLTKKTPKGEMDDAAVLRLCQRAREKGFNAFVVPQPPELPFANRREDILIVRPGI